MAPSDLDLAGCGLKIIASRLRCVRNPLRARLYLREADDPEPIKQKPAWKGGSAFPANREKLLSGIESFLQPRR